MVPKIADGEPDEQVPCAMFFTSGYRGYLDTESHVNRVPLTAD
jgi:hypothetical protein